MLKSFCFTTDTTDISLAKYTTTLIYPLVYKDNTFAILPYQTCTQEVQQWVARAILEVWGEVANVNTMEDTINYILTNWRQGDIFYVLFVNGILTGFVAMDEKNFYPWMSHLYIHPHFRRRGYAGVLIQFCKHYTI
ncbi:GNAT family N-acetyltransferase, partial [bacterium]|nr:GNAT family N-acetyltransferase [bacterium]